MVNSNPSLTFLFSFQPQLTVTIQETAGPVTNALCKLLQDFRGSSGGTLNPRQLFGEICKKYIFFYFAFDIKSNMDLLDQTGLMD